MEKQLEEKQKKERNPNHGLWYDKKNRLRVKLVTGEKAQPLDGYTKARPLHNVPYQIFDEASGKWVPDPEGEKKAEIERIKSELAQIDKEAGSGRAVRALALAAALKSDISGYDYNRLQAMEEKAQALRSGLAELEALITGGNE